MFSAAILTISDKGARGERADKSGPTIREMLSGRDCRVTGYEIVPDEQAVISAKLIEWADSDRADVIITTGGTGLAPRDVTPEATLAVIEKPVPGLAEVMRLKTLDKAPTSVLSRAVAGVRHGCLIVNLPGSPRAVRECLEIILPVIPHAVDTIHGRITEHVIKD
ncbi:MAG: MogA/MoaB family molybdenum cofactor biosynthesis protein [Chloroflexi bacterium]|nr:MogA/MoaB family molybdenum cofactor biosynthesis protein [Chloroflexota bacterium]